MKPSPHPSQPSIDSTMQNEQVEMVSHCEELNTLVAEELGVSLAAGPVRPVAPVLPVVRECDE